MRNAFRIFRRDMKRLLRSPAAVLVMIGVCIIPSLYAWFNIAANIDPYSNTSGIKVAVANNDKDATSNDLTINAGNEIIILMKKSMQLHQKSQTVVPAQSSFKSTIPFHPLHLNRFQMY